MPTVRSADGTEIAYDVFGTGPAVILVDGALAFRTFGSSPALAALLAPSRRVYSYDRRGRGESGTGHATPDILEREVEDIDTLIELAGTASLYGISSGGALVLEAAMRLGARVERVAVYEIPYDASEAGIAAWVAYRTELAELVQKGDRGGAVELFMRLVGASDDGVKGMRQSPAWPTFEAVAPTLVNDAAALGDDRRPPVERVRVVTAPALVMDGSASLAHMPFMRVSAEVLTNAMPNARHEVLEGQTHQVDIQVLAPYLLEFFSGRNAPVQTGTAGSVSRA
ncbi:MAG: alpha/beta hydrolase [Candidatus Dormibacteraeota bacterium]|nr:alpha/beta hydrolase [Candidatus Dormibacteraeota bacterium]